jgi:hypothetical protein
MAKSLLEIEEAAQKVADGMEIVYTLNRTMLPLEDFSAAEVEEVLIRAARKFFEAHNGRNA